MAETRVHLCNTFLLNLVLLTSDWLNSVIGSSQSASWLRHHKGQMRLQHSGWMLALSFWHLESLQIAVRKNKRTLLSLRAVAVIRASVGMCEEPITLRHSGHVGKSVSRVTFCEPEKERIGWGCLQGSAAMPFNLLRRKKRRVRNVSQRSM